LALRALVIESGTFKKFEFSDLLLVDVTQKNIYIFLSKGVLKRKKVFHVSIAIESFTDAIQYFVILYLFNVQIMRTAMKE